MEKAALNIYKQINNGLGVIKIPNKKTQLPCLLKESQAHPEIMALLWWIGITEATRG